MKYSHLHLLFILIVFSSCTKEYSYSNEHKVENEPVVIAVPIIADTPRIRMPHPPLQTNIKVVNIVISYNVSILPNSNGNGNAFMYVNFVHVNNPTEVDLRVTMAWTYAYGDKVYNIGANKVIPNGAKDFSESMQFEVPIDTKISNIAITRIVSDNPSNYIFTW